MNPRNLSWAALTLPLFASVAHAQVTTCRANTDCSAGKVCGVENAQYFADQAGSACWPASCQNPSYQCANCGSVSATCGECPPAEQCNVEARDLKVRFWNLEANDGSGATTGTTADRARRFIDPARTVMIYETADETLEQCSATAKLLQGTFESLQTVQVRPECLVPSSSAACAADYDAITASSRDFLNVIWINSVGGGPGAFARGGAYAGNAPPWLAVTGASNTQPFSLTFLHEVGHVMLRGYAPLNQYSGDHYPSTDPLCEPQAADGNIMCSFGRGLSITADQCAHMFDNEVVPKTIRQGAKHGSYRVYDLTLRGASPGNYRLKINGPTEGYVYLMKDGVQVAQSAWYSWQTTVTQSQGYTFQFTNYFDITVRRAASGSMNLYALNTDVFDNKRMVHVPSPLDEPIRPGRKYGPYVVSDVVLKGAAAGSYYFEVSKPYTQIWRVTLKKRGSSTALASVDYYWNTPVGSTQSYTFAFPGYFDVVVRTDHTAQNLYDLGASLFDGNRVLNTTP